MVIWDAIKDKAINHKNDENEAIADLYSDLVLDVRFALSTKGEWGLSDDSKIENIKNKFDSTPIKKKKSDLDDGEENAHIDEDDEDLEVYDDLFVEEEEDDSTSIYYDEDED